MTSLRLLWLTTIVLTVYFLVCLHAWLTTLLP